MARSDGRVGRTVASTRTMAEQMLDTVSEDGPLASFETADGDLVIYDRQEPTTWFQSDTVSDIEAWR